MKAAAADAKQTIMATAKTAANTSDMKGTALRSLLKLLRIISYSHIII